MQIALLAPARKNKMGIDDGLSELRRDDGPELAVDVLHRCAAVRHSIDRAVSAAQIGLDGGRPSFDSEEAEIAFQIRYEQAFVQEGLRRHHALDDASALRLAWLNRG